MKVEQQGKQFEPVTIILETEEEFKKLWDIMNAASGNSLTKYDSEFGFKTKELEELKSELFNRLDEEVRK